jgi:restriction endonuclease
MEFENGLKLALGTTLEYGENRERVKIEKYDLLNILKIYAACDETQFVQTLQKELELNEVTGKVKTTAKTFLEKVYEVSRDITVEVLKGLIVKTLSPGNSE